MGQLEALPVPGSLSVTGHASLVPLLALCSGCRWTLAADRQIRAEVLQDAGCAIVAADVSSGVSPACACPVVLHLGVPHLQAYDTRVPDTWHVINYKVSLLPQISGLCICAASALPLQLATGLIAKKCACL